MADHQRIHPELQDPEVPAIPTAPLVPRGSSKSDQGTPADPYPPFQRTIPVTHAKPPKRRRNCFCRCLCCTLCLILVLIVVIGILAAIFYFAFDPKIPKYSVDSMRITQLDLNNNTLYATFGVNITARNPNKRIGIYYEGGSKLSAWYAGTELCEGPLPKFYQGHRNTTLLDVTLSGQTDDASGLLASLQAQQQTGSIPLRLRVRVPVRIKLGKLKLPKWKILVRCSVTVNSLAADNVISIRDSGCKFRFRL